MKEIAPVYQQPYSDWRPYMPKQKFEANAQLQFILENMLSYSITESAQNFSLLICAMSGIPKLQDLAFQFCTSKVGNEAVRSNG